MLTTCSKGRTNISSLKSPRAVIGNQGKVRYSLLVGARVGPGLLHCGNYGEHDGLVEVVETWWWWWWWWGGGGGGGGGGGATSMAQASLTSNPKGGGRGSLVQLHT